VQTSHHYLQVLQTRRSVTTCAFLLLLLLLPPPPPTTSLTSPHVATGMHTRTDIP
jgi:hypothetical protein